MRKKTWSLVAATALLSTTAAYGQSSGEERSVGDVLKEALIDLLTPPTIGGPFLSGTDEPEGTKVVDDAIVRIGRPVEAFQGCTGPKNLGANLADPSERMQTRQASMTDPVSARTFAAIDIGAAENVTAEDLANDCRFRLDGIWTQDVQIAFDNSKTPDGFSGLPGQSLNPHLTHASFTTPVLMYVGTADNGETLSMRPATSGHEPTILKSTDGVALIDVLRPGGAMKTYVTIASPPTVLEVDVTRSGRVRLRWAKQNFYRPKPTVSQRNDVSSVDVFAIGFNLDNLAANRRGYNIATQDVFRLNDNMMAEVFAVADPRDYAIVEKRTVPLGLKLIPEGEQGTVTSSRLISSQAQYQDTVSKSLGVNIGYSARHPDTGAELGGASAGFDYTKSKTAGMTSGRKSSFAIGYARHKLYSLVLDQPFVKLSEEFLDAVDDARRYQRYDELIEKFGTHYPYAVSYGSAARMQAELSQETVSKWRDESENLNTNAGLSIGGFELGVTTGQYSQTSKNNSYLEEGTLTDFEAVGGTGSFSEAGHSTTTPYPILLDLRPLHELLNPLNFPMEPEIYGPVRDNLEKEIEAYLIGKTGSLSSASTLPDVTQIEVLKPADLPKSFFADGTPIVPKVQSGSDRDATVTVCLQNGGGWNQGIGRSNRPWKQVEVGKYECIYDLPPLPLDFDFYKAKAFGIMTKVKTQRLDLTGHGSDRIMLHWNTE